MQSVIYGLQFTNSTDSQNVPNIFIRTRFPLQKFVLTNIAFGRLDSADISVECKSVAKSPYASFHAPNLHPIIHFYVKNFIIRKICI